MTLVPRHDLLIRQGDDWSIALDWVDIDDAGAETPVDLTGAAAIAHIRADVAERSAVIWAALHSADVAIPAAAGAAGSIVIDPAPDPVTGRRLITLSLAASASAAIPAAGPGRPWVYDLRILFPGGRVVTMVEGAVVVTAARSRVEEV